MRGRGSAPPQGAWELSGGARPGCRGSLSVSRRAGDEAGRLRVEGGEPGHDRAGAGAGRLGAALGPATPRPVSRHCRRRGAEQAPERLAPSLPGPVRRRQDNENCPATRHEGRYQTDSGPRLTRTRQRRRAGRRRGDREAGGGPALTHPERNGGATAPRTAREKVATAC